MYNSLFFFYELSRYLFIFGRAGTWLLLPTGVLLLPESGGSSPGAGRRLLFMVLVLLRSTGPRLTGSRVAA